MDIIGLDGEAYIAAIRAGAIDPHGQTADELQDSLDDFDREWSQRIAAMTNAELDDAIAGRIPVPPLPGPAESEHTRRDRLDREFTGRMRALQAQRSRLEAEERELLAERLQRVQDDGGEQRAALREAASVLAAELRVSDRTIERRMTAAWQLTRELPLAHGAHKAGRIGAGHLRVIEQATEALRLDSTVEAAERTRVEEALVAIAESTTPGRLRSRAKRIVERVLTAPLQQRHAVARETRTVSLFDAGDGMVDIAARVPATFGAAVFDRLTQSARQKPKDDPRTFDQYRADAFIELLLTGQTPADLHGLNPLQATISVTIPATAMLRDDDPGDPELRFPALLDGRIVVDAATIRSLAADTVTWERLFLDPVSGVPVTVDAYRPNRAMRRWLRARDGRCRWPGCSTPVTRADVDHTDDFANGGRTTLGNLSHLCRRHHSMKHATRWTVEQLEDGLLQWTSPLGEVLRDEPEPQGPRFVDTGIDTGVEQPPWGSRPGAAPSMPNAPPVPLPF